MRSRLVTTFCFITLLTVVLGWGAYDAWRSGGIGAGWVVETVDDEVCSGCGESSLMDPSPRFWTKLGRLFYTAVEREMRCR